MHATDLLQHGAAAFKAGPGHPVSCINTHPSILPSEAAATTMAVEELLPAAHTADAASITVEVTLGGQVTVGHPAVHAKIFCKAYAAANAVGSCGHLLPVAAAIAGDQLQQVPGQLVVFFL